MRRNTLILKLVSAAIILLLISPSFTFAAVTNAYVSTPQDTPIVIDLQNNITDSADLNFDSITITSAPSNGQASPVAGFQQITYTPNANFNGSVDVFEYTVLDINGASQGSATVTVSVGIAVLSTGNNTAQVEINDTLNNACLAPTDQGFNDLCADYFNATEGERAILANQLAPKEIDGQTQLSASVASQQIDIIRKRLAAIRLGMQGIFPIQLTYRHPGQRPLSIAELFREDARGGAASALGTPARRLGVFASGNFGRGNYNPGADSSEDGYNYHSNNATVGFDYRLSGQFVYGAAMGALKSSMTIDAGGGDLDATGYSTIGYASYYLNSKTYIETIAAAYLNNFKATRKMVFTGIQVDPITGNATKVIKTPTAHSETDNGVVSFSFGAGYEMLSRRGVTFNLSGNVDYISSGIDGYQETGAEGANLTIEKRKETKITSTINLQTTFATSQPGGILIRQLDFAWKHEFGDDSNTIRGAFVADPINTKFSFDTKPIETDYLKISLGVLYLIPGGTTGFASYEETVGRGDFRDRAISIGMRGEF